MNKKFRKLLVAAGVVTLVMVGAPPASASDWGGYANPAASGCGTNSLVKEKPVYTESGAVAAVLQIKWSAGCPGNYARVEMRNGYVASTVALSVQGPRNLAAGTDEVNISGAVWTFVIANGATEQVCAYTDIRFTYQSASAPRRSQTVCG